MFTCYIFTVNDSFFSFLLRIMVTNAVLIIMAVIPLYIELDIRYLLSGLLVSSVRTAVVHYRQSFY